MVLHEEDKTIKIAGMHVSLPTNEHSKNESFPLKELEEREQVLNRMVGEKTKSLQQDLRDCKQVEEELQQAHRILNIILDNIDAIIYVIDMHTYEILFINN